MAIVAIALMFVLSACGSTSPVSTQSATANDGTAQYQQAASAAATADAKNNSGDNNNPYTAAPAATPHYKVGEPVTSGTWQITINGEKTSAGSEYDQALKQGDTYLTINFTLKNLSATAQSLWLFTLRDSQGNTYDSTYLSGNRQSYGTIVSGQQLRGDLSYEVPTATHSLMLQFDSIGDYDGSQIVQWTIKD